MATRLGFVLLILFSLSLPGRADDLVELGFKLDPLPELVLRHLADPGQYSHFECNTQAGPEAAGLYPILAEYPDFALQEAYSSPNGAFPDSHETWGGPPDSGDPGPLPTP